MPRIIKPEGSKKWLLFYTDHTGRRRKATLEADRETSEHIARDLLSTNALRKRGILDERDENFSEHEAKPLKVHLEDYARVVRAEGATEKHVLELTVKIERVLELAKIRRIRDITLSGIQEAIAKIRKTGSTGTTNNYIQRFKSFDRWLWRDKRAREYVLVDLHQKDAKNDRRHVRRRMTDEEVTAVIAAAERGPAVHDVSGPDRAILYRIAHGTGFRAKELRTLTPERFRLEDDPPIVTSLACYTKNGEQAVQPIARALAELLRPWLATKTPGKPVFTAKLGPDSRDAAG
jgi:Phage integrase family